MTRRGEALSWLCVIWMAELFGSVALCAGLALLIFDVSVRVIVGSALVVAGVGVVWVSREVRTTLCPSKHSTGPK